MRALTWEDFAGGSGRSYRLRLGEEACELQLAKAEELAGAGRSGGSFRLEFVGPQQPILPQAIYALERDGESFDIFIVPVASGPRGTTYEAIFN
ncbi:DUF6916 family protein [Novosphingobium album (ex Liu et al. 2023)]|uniref:DUF6916 domain-containing protein n=1 Tax=Novosphingobium album (ex Liu et al. 2023) TaxID=3031130 RepID=A0ABT5WMN1_9SPHN|nr:hypothetical protein [Novosphingobium album (ex Liu et al. 2023)]MDE8651306.1 hypothetical protein [Novosphingobium album (ex Liu et al. 2023)]